MRSALFAAIVIGLVLVGCGVYALVKGIIPGMVFGDKRYKTEGAGARVIGALLLAPVPLLLWDFGIGFVSILVILFAVYFVNKAVRRPVG